MDILNELVKLADFLDESGLESFASKIDSEIIKIADYTDDNTEVESYGDGLIASSRMPDGIQSRYPIGTFLVKNGYIYLFMPNSLVEDYIEDGGISSQFEEGIGVVYAMKNFLLDAKRYVADAKFGLESLPGPARVTARKEAFSDVAQDVLLASESLDLYRACLPGVIDFLKVIRYSASRGMRGYSLDYWNDITSNVIRGNQLSEILNN